jgi:hypothetical protein
MNLTFKNRYALLGLFFLGFFPWFRMPILRVFAICAIEPVSIIPEDDCFDENNAVFPDAKLGLSSSVKNRV